MRINRSMLLALRKQRAWSQDELAVAAGLNLRTVQRIERSGTASLQSKKAPAAAFNIEINDLDAPEEAMTTQYEYRVVRFDLNWSTIGGKLLTDVAGVQKQMNELGKDGWDLVRMSEILGAGPGVPYTFALIAIFKRTAP
jgi:transcriptional regulator with XRE-family HTH domain